MSVDVGVVEPVRKSTIAIVHELRMLPRGRGILADDIGLRVGPLLRELCEVLDSDDIGILRRKVGQRLSALSDRLPGDLGHAVRLALALGGSSDRFLKDRVDHLATTIRRDPRTAKRRVDEGLRRLAEVITEEVSQVPKDANPFVPDSWYVSSLRSNLLLDRDPPQLIERRQIVATAADVDSVVAALSVPTQGGDTETRPARIEVLQGGLLVRESHPARGHCHGTIHLPRSLWSESAHEYTVLFTGAASWDAVNCYALTAFRRCDQFELRVRFDRSRRALLVREFGGLPPQLVTEPDPDIDIGVVGSGGILAVDAVGEIHASFTDLRPGLSYGVRWSDRCGGHGPVTALETYG